jgi:hypothetical protein
MLIDTTTRMADPPIGVAKAIARGTRRKFQPHGLANRVRAYLRDNGLEDATELCRRLRISRQMLHKVLTRPSVTAVLRRRPK